MDSETKTLPWNNSIRIEKLDLSPWLADRRMSDLRRYLPRETTLWWEPSLGRGCAEALAAQIAEFLAAEVTRRRRRCVRIEASGLLTHGELENILVRDDQQPWAIYALEDGGLGTGSAASAPDGEQGIIPCVGKPNHAVAWRRAGTRPLVTWLATAREKGGAWDLEADFGHESAHAAFAQVPLFDQVMQDRACRVRLWDCESIDDLQDVHLAKVAYICSEIGVVTIRGESRATATGLPVDSAEELLAFLRIASQLFPGAGFARAAVEYERNFGALDIEEGEVIYDIGTPVLRLLPALAPLANAERPPTRGWFQGLAPAPETEMAAAR
jgi:hypothetical protein